MMSRDSFRWLAVLFVLAATPLAAQHHVPAHDLEDPQEFRITAPSGVAEIPFRLVNNHVIIPVSVNDSDPFQLILDTGMPMTGLILYDSDKVQALDLEIDPGMKAQVAGAGGRGKPFEAEIATDVSWSLPDLRATRSHLTILPPIPHLTHYHEGIIGASLFGNFVVEIDNDDHVIRLYDPAEYRAPAGRTSIPLDFQIGIPFVEISATMANGTPASITVPVDLGAGHPISLNSDSHEAIDAPDGAIETVIGRGLSGPVRGQVGRIAALDLGGYELREVIAMFPVSRHQHPGGMDSRHGNLGNGVLSRFNVIFDYEHDRMLLEPNGRFGEPFEFDMSGIVFQQDDKRGVWIESILPDSPAEEAGLRPDDVILSVDGIDAAAAGYHTIREGLRTEGASVTILFRRGKKERQVTLELRRLV